MKFTGRVQNGRLIPDNPASYPIALRECEGKPVTVEVEVRRERRSVKANAYHWGIIVPLAQHALNLKRGPEMIPLSKDQVHYVLVTAFGASEETELGPVPVRSSLMDSKQFSALDEKAARWLMDQGYGIPDGPGAAVQVAEAME